MEWLKNLFRLKSKHRYPRVLIDGLEKLANRKECRLVYSSDYHRMQITYKNVYKKDLDLKLMDKACEKELYGVVQDLMMGAISEVKIMSKCY